jgi:hypothetical protein
MPAGNSYDRHFWKVLAVTVLLVLATYGTIIMLLAAAE